MRRLLLFAVLACSLASLEAQTAAPARPHNNIARRRIPLKALQAPLSPGEQAAQVVNRFTFGPTPGMVRAVATQGWGAWFAQQLQPSSIPDTELAKRLARYPSLAMLPAQLAVNFPDGQVIRRLADGKEAMPADPRLAGAYQVLVARYKEKQKQDAAAAATPGVTGPGAAASDSKTDNGQKAEEKAAEQARAAVLAGPILADPAPARLDAVLALPVPDRMALTRGLADPMKTELLQGVSPRDRELWTMMAGGYGGNGVAAGELEQAKVLRTVLSQRQLQEVMTDFWLNHFNIDIAKSGDENLYVNQYEQEVIRLHALGKFRDLLVATAESPAMMIYLDNLTSIGPDSPSAGRGKKAGQAGLNENYGREVMELHTLGVNGGYTQADVTALAAILTGWGVDRPNQGGPFVFQPNRHEPGTKQWLGHTVAEAGQKEGLDALAYLAAQPATARHISYELAQRFVADTPPPALVDRMTEAWMRSDGDIAEVLRAMVGSPEFFDRASYGNKIKTPLEFVASAMRATQTDPANPAALAQQLRAMGEPLYRCQPPNGYPQAGSGWMNSSALINRLNFALALSSGKLGGMHMNAPLLVASGLLAGPEPSDGTAPARSRNVVLPQSAPPVQDGQEQALALLEKTLVAGPVSSQTNVVIRAQLAQQGSVDTAAQLATMAAMVLGSPEFQVH